MKKVTRRNFLRAAASSAAAITATMLVGCDGGKNKEELASVTASESLPAESNSAELADEPEVVENDVSDELGVWTLEECKEQGGLYYKTDDDRFILYNEFQCTKDIGDESYTVLANMNVYDKAIATPVNTLCFFMWPEYKSDNFWTMAYRIIGNGWMPTIVFPGDEEYRFVTSLYVSEDREEVELFSRYGMTNFKNLWIKTINGETAGTSKEIVPIVDYGVGGDVKAFSENMKGQLVTFGYVEGTTLTEQECYMGEFFGIYSNKVEDSWTPVITPTTDGYVTLEYPEDAENEEGLYILEIGVQEGNNKTVKRNRTLLNLKH